MAHRLDRILASAATWIAGFVLCVVPFHAFLTVWASSLVGHYTALRLWDDALLLVLVVLCCWWLVRNHALAHWFFGSLLVRLMLAYGVLTLILGFASLAKGDVVPKALAYGLLINLRFLLWFMAVLLTAQRSPFLRTHWRKLLLYPAALVVGFAVLQYTVLPHQFLGHFGYDAQTTIAPIETINHNPHYIRVQATLRGANPLGAYLVVVLAALFAYVAGRRRRWLAVAYGLLALFALYATGSRSAWIGAVLSLVVIALLRLPGRYRTWFAAAGLAVVLLAAGSYLMLKDNVAFQNAVLHTQSHSQVAISSNEAHASATESALGDVLRQPLGDGPGTAGPASVYNTGHNARIAEDYYVQIAQETGWLGLALLLGVFVLVGWELYARWRESQLALVLVASFLGLAFVALLSHSWADDTLAYIWWGLAGITLAKPLERTVLSTRAKASVTDA